MTVPPIMGAAIRCTTDAPRGEVEEKGGPSMPPLTLYLSIGFTMRTEEESHSPPPAVHRISKDYEEVT